MNRRRFFEIVSGIAAFIGLKPKTPSIIPKTATEVATVANEVSYRYVYVAKTLDDTNYRYKILKRQ